MGWLWGGKRGAGGAVHPTAFLQVGQNGEAEEWGLVHQLANEPDARSMEVPNLNPYTYYRQVARAVPSFLGDQTTLVPVVTLLSPLSFRMRQVNIVGTSPPSLPSRRIQTLQAPPDVAPANVTLRTASETSLWLRWMVRVDLEGLHPWAQCPLGQPGVAVGHWE